MRYYVSNEQSDHVAALYPYLHYAVFRDAEKEQRISNARNLMHELRPQPSMLGTDGGAKELFGSLLLIVKVASSVTRQRGFAPAAIIP